jgi:DNA replication protein DnaC
MTIAFNRYYESNIPMAYWDLEMNRFEGPKELLNIYNRVIENISLFYREGKSLCLAGANGIGKTSTATNILKQACQRNYNSLYTTLSDIVSVLIDSPYDSKFLARKELMTADFLVCDELDPRWISENGADLFARTLESIFRTRQQNKLPTIFCTNSPNPIEAFSGALKQSIGSLMSSTDMVIAFGDDYRKKQK